jgi:membrane-associated phospholipid phosphatase
MSADRRELTRWNRRAVLKLGAASTAVLGTATVPGLGLGLAPRVAAQGAEPVEPRAGTWKTWLVSSASELRVPSPPDSTVEVAEVRARAGQRDAAMQQQIAYWDAGSPAYRWNEIALDLCNVKNNLSGSVSERALTLMNAAIYDAAVAAWAAKYAYNRPRPNTLDSSLSPAVAVPPTPAYPAEHAVAAGAAAAVLAHLFPGEAAVLGAQAAEAAASRVAAGVQYPSDVAAGLDLGRGVAERAIARANADNFDAKWEGTIPTEPDKWTGPEAVNADESLWRPWLLEAPSQLRPGPPPAPGSPQMDAELAEITDFPRTPRTNGIALGWQYGILGSPNHHILWNRHASRLLFEDRLDANLPRAAQVYLLTMMVMLDTWIATQETKFYYWGIRPFQLDPTLTTVFPTPPFPSYPSNRASFNPAAALILGYYFPREASRLEGIADEISESAIWAGIHFRSDLTSAQNIGQTIARMALERAV